MNYPVWELPAPGLLIAAVAILHVFISHFAVGGGLFLVLAETKARREGDEAFLGFVRALSRGFILLTLVLGALTGVGIWFTIALVQPQATSALVTIFVWAWAIEWTFFATEIAAAMVYYYGWDRLDAKTHLRVGWIYFASAWASLVVIAGILAFMLTSGDWVRTPGLRRRLLQPDLPADGGAAHGGRGRPGRPLRALRRVVPEGRGPQGEGRALVGHALDRARRGPRGPLAAVVPLGRGGRRRRGRRDAGREVGLARRRCSPRLRHGRAPGSRSCAGRRGWRSWGRRSSSSPRSPSWRCGARRYGRLEARAAHGPRPRVDGRQRVGARGPAQAVGDRPLHVRERRAGARTRRDAGRATTRSRSTRSASAGSSPPRPGRRRPPPSARATRPSSGCRSPSGPRSRSRPAARSSGSSAPPATPSAATSASGGWSGARASPRSRPSSTRRRSR